jgi:hypothetical protein
MQSKMEETIEAKEWRSLSISVSSEAVNPAKRLIEKQRISSGRNRQNTPQELISYESSSNSRNFVWMGLIDCDSYESSPKTISEICRQIQNRPASKSVNNK